MNRNSMDFEYFLMIDAFQDYMFKSTNIEKIEELCNDDLDIVYGVKTVNEVRMAFYLHREIDGSYETKDDNDTFKCVGVVYLLRDFQPLVDLDRPGMFERIKKSRLDIFDYYLFYNPKKHDRFFRTYDKRSLVALRKDGYLIWGVVTEFGAERAYQLYISKNEPVDYWPTIRHTKFNSLSIDYIEAVHGKIMQK